MDPLDAFRRRWQPEIDRELSAILERIGRDPGCPGVLLDAMRHAVLGGGKRLRPLLCLAALRAAGGREQEGLRAACAIELVHAYSLVHDDLPAMDDDDVRRGKPTCHKAYGEALAILAGDGLLTQAFGVLAEGMPAGRAAEAVRLMADRAGVTGMVGGQVDDVREPDRPPALETVEGVHLRKTAAMFELSVRLGGLLAGAPAERLDRLSAYGRALGLAFQIVDDLLAYRGRADKLMRPTGSDAEQGRRTHPQLAGQQSSRERVTALISEAREALLPFGERAAVLTSLADFVDRRAD